MPLYEDKHNAENRIKVTEQTMQQAWFGTEQVVNQIACEIKEGKKKIALDGWYAVDFAGFVSKLEANLKEQEINSYQHIHYSNL